MNSETISENNPPATDAFQQERERLQARYAEIATLAGGLAHEIRNPLSTIRMNLEMLAEDLEDGETPRERQMINKIERLQRSCHHLEDILSAFLQFARVGELELVETDLNEQVREFIEFYEAEADQHQIEISPHLAMNLPRVCLDLVLFRQILLNLARNALQAMPAGGTLELQSFEKEGRVYLNVIDTGQGMNEATREKIFQAFFSTKSAGSGLGLPTVRKIVEAHQGTIDCASAEGQGTQFTISLPAAEGSCE